MSNSGENRHPDDVVIRHATVDDADRFNRSMAITFLEDPAEPARMSALIKAAWLPDRSWGAFAGDEVVGTLRTLPRQLSVPGPAGCTLDISADALTNVTVAATHRRRGVLRRMLGESLDAARARGELVSILIAAEWPIYGRFGYWPASTWAELRIERRRRGAVMTPAVSGTLRRVDPAELRSLAPPVFDIARRQRAGHINRTDFNWDRRLLPEHLGSGERERIGIVHETDEGVDGFLTWHPTTDFDLDRGGLIRVDQLFATSQRAYTALWAYVMGMDAVDEVTIKQRPPDEPLPYLLADGRAVSTTRSTDAMWLRLLDLPGALAARRYASSGRLCLDVVDEDYGGFAAGRVVLESGPDGATCASTTTQSPDLRLSQRALAAVYLGQPSLRRQHSAGYVDELTPGAVDRADTMFATALQPWVGTEF